MIKKAFRWLTLVVALLIVLLLVNAYRVRPWPTTTARITLAPLPDSAVRHMSEAIQIPTVTVSDSSALDTAAFRQFGHFLERAYPLVHQQLARTVVRQFSYLYEWKGQKSQLAPLVLMAHYDVVP